MYLLRGAVVAIGSFFVAYVALSVALAVFWSGIRIRAANLPSHVLFALRLLPLTASLLFALGFVIPSYLRFEPVVTGEVIGFTGMALAGAGVAVVLFGMLRLIQGHIQSERFVAAQSADCVPIQHSGNARVLCVSHGLAGLLVAGIRRPTLMVARATKESLSSQEMDAAIRHELAHVERHDNLKKLLLRVSGFPFLSGLNEAWVCAAEMEADDRAVQDPQGALDLASALVKVARTRASLPIPSAAMSLVPHEGAPLARRVDRLLSWSPRSSNGSHTKSAWFAVSLLAGAALFYGPALTIVHDMTETLLR